MDRETFQKKLDAIEGMTLDTVERHDRLIALIVRFIKEEGGVLEMSPCDANSLTSSFGPVSGQTYSVLPPDASVSEC